MKTGERRQETERQTHRDQLLSCPASNVPKPSQKYGKQRLTLNKKCILPKYNTEKTAKWKISDPV